MDWVFVVRVVVVVGGNGMAGAVVLSVVVVVVAGGGALPHPASRVMAPSNAAPVSARTPDFWFVMLTSSLRGCRRCRGAARRYRRCGGLRRRGRRAVAGRPIGIAIGGLLRRHCVAAAVIRALGLACAQRSRRRGNNGWYGRG